MPSRSSCLPEAEAIVDTRGSCEKRVCYPRRKEKPEPNTMRSWRASCKHSHLIEEISVTHNLSYFNHLSRKHFVNLRNPSFLHKTPPVLSVFPSRRDFSVMIAENSATGTQQVQVEGSQYFTDPPLRRFEYHDPLRRLDFPPVRLQHSFTRSKQLSKGSAGNGEHLEHPPVATSEPSTLIFYAIVDVGRIEMA